MTAITAWAQLSGVQTHRELACVIDPDSYHVVLPLAIGESLGIGTPTELASLSGRDTHFAVARVELSGRSAVIVVAVTDTRLPVLGRSVLYALGLRIDEQTLALVPQTPFVPALMLPFRVTAVAAR